MFIYNSKVSPVVGINRLIIYNVLFQAYTTYVIMYVQFYNYVYLYSSTLYTFVNLTLLFNF